MWWGKSVGGRSRMLQVGSFLLPSWCCPPLTVVLLRALTGRRTRLGLGCEQIWGTAVWGLDGFVVGSSQLSSFPIQPRMLDNHANTIQHPWGERGALWEVGLAGKGPGL